jgi:Na+/proline symporter
MGGGMYLVFGCVPVALGLLGAHYVFGATDAAELSESPDAFIPALARSLLSPPVQVLFAGAMISAILSTVDSTLLAIGALASHNLLPKPKGGAERSPWAARLMVAGAGVASCAMALSAERIFDLVLQADSLGTGGLVVLLVVALFTRWGGPVSAIATLATGLVSAIVAGQALEAEVPFLTSLVCSAGVFAVVAPVERACRGRTAGRA